jgi:DNA-binding XRE family transcriptional regulator
MSKIAKYSANLDMIKPFITRNAENIQEITAPSFWINDVTQPDATHRIEIFTISQKNWLKITQAQSETCTVFPVDGNEGVFKYPPPVQHPENFLLDNKQIGGCDFLLVKEKWLFVELKTEATSQSLLQIEENRDKARLQLARTLASFQENMPQNTLNKANCICIMVTPTFFPKISKIPFAETIKFLKRFGVPLQENTTDEPIKI